jgi:hypothetical protein
MINTTDLTPYSGNKTLLALASKGFRNPSVQSFTMDAHGSAGGAILQHLRKAEYRLPSLQTFNIESFGNVGHVLYAGNM